MKLSQWHDGRIKPIHIGVYEKNISDIELSFSYWNGAVWLLACSSVEESARYKDRPLNSSVSTFQTDLEWRGIVK